MIEIQTRQSVRQGVKHILCYIDYDHEKRETAGFKAPDDIAEICRQIGCRRLTLPYFPFRRSKHYKKLWMLTVGLWSWLKMAKSINEEDVIIFQHPTYPTYGKRITEKMIRRIKKQKNCRFIAFIHDLEPLREGIDGVPGNFKKTTQIIGYGVLKYFDVIICHNDSMKSWMIERGFDPDILFPLELFDYLTEAELQNRKRNETPQICIAGFLSKEKCSYIYDIIEEKEHRNDHLILDIYGKDFSEKDSNPRMIYHGAFPPDILPGILEGDFGLIWDGLSVDTCSGNSGVYLRYNSPHKTSLYLVAGIPVIVWKEAAIADFVLRYQVGIAVDSLLGLDEILQSVSLEEYQRMRENALEISKRLKTGYYTRRALQNCIDYLKEE